MAKETKDSKGFGPLREGPSPQYGHGMFDFGAFEASLLANAILLAPVDIAVVLLVARIYREVGKLSATYEMIPDLTAEQRRFARWWVSRNLKSEMDLQRKLAEPGKPAPWEA